MFNAGFREVSAQSMEKKTRPKVIASVSSHIRSSLFYSIVDRYLLNKCRNYKVVSGNYENSPVENKLIFQNYEEHVAYIFKCSTLVKTYISAKSHVFSIDAATSVR